MLIHRYAHIPHSSIIPFFIRIKRKFYWGPMYSQYFCSIDIYSESLCGKRKWATYALVDHLGETAKRRKSQKTFLDHLFAKSKAILVGYICLLSMAVQNMTWRTMGSKVLFSSGSSQSFLKRSRGRNSKQDLEAGTEAEAMEDHCLLAGSPWLAQIVYYAPQDYFPTGDTIHTGLGSPTSVI